MATNVCTPYYEPGSRVTGRATGEAVVGKRFVAVAAAKDPGSRELDPGATGGNIKIRLADAGDEATFGVAEFDAPDGKTTTVLRGGFIVPVTAGGAITAGDFVAPGADGKAVTEATRAGAYGIALADAVNNQDAIVALYS
jgi:hypothetical protein